MGSGIPAHNINTWSGYTPAPYPRDNLGAILPDPSTGGLYDSTVPMQDTTHIDANWAAAPIAAPWIPTIGTQVGAVTAENGW